MFRANLYVLAAFFLLSLAIIAYAFFGLEYPTDWNLLVWIIVIDAIVTALVSGHRIVRSILWYRNLKKTLASVPVESLDDEFDEDDEEVVEST